GGIQGARPASLAADAGESDEIISTAPADIFDGDVAAALAQIETVLIEKSFEFPVNGAPVLCVEAQIGDRPGGAVLQGNTPGVVILQAEVSDGKILHFGEQDPDVAPVSGLAFAGFSRVSAVGPFSQGFSGIPRRPGAVGSFQNHFANA